MLHTGLHINTCLLNNVALLYAPLTSSASSLHSVDVYSDEHTATYTIMLYIIIRLFIIINTDLLYDAINLQLNLVHSFSLFTRLMRITLPIYLRIMKIVCMEIDTIWLPHMMPNV
jgi:hypothetical protein